MGGLSSLAEHLPQSSLVESAQNSPEIKVIWNNYYSSLYFYQTFILNVRNHEGLNRANIVNTTNLPWVYERCKLKSC